MDPTRELYLTIMDKQQILFDAPVRSLTSKNAKGKFDILPEHTNFISIINDEIIARPTGGGEQKIPVGNEAVLRVLNGRIQVFIGFGNI